jgi:DNA polymerase-1
MKIVEGLPPRQHYGSVALDLEIFNGNRLQLHRPYGDFACLGISDGKTVWLITRAADVEKALQRVSRARWYVHNGSFDLRHLRRWADIPVRSGEAFRDTFLVERLLWGGYYDHASLADVARRYLRVRLEKDTREEFIRNKNGLLTEDMKAYAAKDPYVTWKIGQIQDKLLSEDGLSEKVWNEIDGPFLWASLVFKGIHLDKKRWLRQARDYEEKAIAIQAKYECNLNAPAQVRAMLKENGVSVPNTQENTLLPFADHPIVKELLEYREAAKRAGTYGDNVLSYLEKDNRIYCEFITIGAETGRTACRDLNLQNQPKEEGYRACYIAVPGNRMVIADYGSQEMRIAAQFAALLGFMDSGLLKAFEQGEDVYTYVIRKVRNNPNIQKSNKSERALGKSLGLGLNYGLTAYGLAQRVPGMTEPQAAQIVQEYFLHFPEMRAYINEANREGQEFGFVRTLAGRRVWVNPYSHQASNNRVNSKIQGSGADQIKLAIAKLHAQYGDHDFPVIGPIHDEILAETSERKVEKLARDVNQAMLDAFVSLCPDVSTKGLVDLSIGKSWADKGH